MVVVCALVCVWGGGGAPPPGRQAGMGRWCCTADTGLRHLQQQPCLLALALLTLQHSAAVQLLWLGLGLPRLFQQE